MNCFTEKICGTCAYLALEPAHWDTDICTHKDSQVADVALNDTCPHHSVHFDPTQLCWHAEDGFDGDLSGMPNARLAQ